MAMILDSADSRGLTAPGESPHISDDVSASKHFDREALLKRLARQGEDLRRRLIGLPEPVKADLRATTKLLEQKKGQPPDAVRAGDDRADRLCRAAASFLDDRLRGRLGVDPAEPLRRLDLHYLMLWQGSRTATDFWARPPASRSRTLPPSPALTAMRPRNSARPFPAGKRQSAFWPMPPGKASSRTWNRRTSSSTAAIRR